MLSDHLAWVFEAAATYFQRSGFPLPYNEPVLNYVADRIPTGCRSFWEGESLDRKTFRPYLQFSGNGLQRIGQFSRRTGSAGRFAICYYINKRFL